MHKKECVILGLRNVQLPFELLYYKLHIIPKNYNHLINRYIKNQHSRLST